MQDDIEPPFAAEAQAESPPPLSAAQLQATELLENIQAIAAGGGYTCALTTAGGVKCWGSNGDGTLGDGTTTDRLLPADVTSFTSGAQAITAGRGHACALTTAGGVKCWGDNYYYQLGDGTQTDRLTPVDVTGLTSGVQAIAAGADHTCALTTDGGVKCWGDNSGALGDGTNTDRPTPVDVSGLASGVQAITAGDGHTCALTTAGGVKCWGANQYRSFLTPGDVAGLTSGVQAIAAGNYHTCALTTAGGVQCWGKNQFGQLGDGTTTDRLTPADVTSLTSGVQAVAAGSYYTCALTTAGGVKCWGMNPSELGDGPITHRLTPVDVTGLAGGVQAIAAGGGHACALTTAGGVKCWGGNGGGQLGDGTTNGRWRPVDVTGLAGGVQAIAAGGRHTCALTTDGGVKCWGYNRYCQLGASTKNSRWTPMDVEVTGLASGVQAIAVGGSHTCALTAAGGVKCWGRNDIETPDDGRLPVVDDSWNYCPTEWGLDVINVTSGVQAIAAGGRHTCALTTAGGVKCWGYGGYGQLGNGTTLGNWVAGDVLGLTSGVQAVTAGYRHSCALTTAGGVKCWGNNWSGRLGDGTTTHRLTPVDVTGLTSGVQAIAAGNNHTCALTDAGGVKCWGYNNDGQLGDGTTTTRLTPVDVISLTSGVQAIAAGGSKEAGHTCALTTTGGVKCWGYNANSQLGNSSTAGARLPVGVTGLTSGVQALAAGGDHTCVLTTAGGVKCWGNNVAGQVGVNPGQLPVDVINPTTPPIDAAELESQIPYTTVTPGAALQVWINVRNTGGSTWQANSGYTWSGAGEWEGQTGAIDGPVAPGQDWLFTRDIVAPAKPGKHVYGLVLQHNGVDFGPQFVIEVTVNSSAVLSNFKVVEHGYSFANGPADTSVLSDSKAYDIFGDAACWQSTGAQCVIRPETEVWANSLERSSIDGQSNGMSITSLRFFSNLDQPGALQSGATNAHDLSNLTPAVPQHIMSYQIRWGVPEVQRRLAATWDDNLEQTLAAIEQSFAAGGEPLVLYISNSWGAHALAPYKVERLGEDDARIYVYDSRYPDDVSRYVAVKPKSGTWQYEFSPGNLWSQSLYAYPAAAFYGPLPWEQPTVTTSDGSVPNADTVLISASPGLELRDAGGQPLARLLVPTGGAGPAPAVYFLPNAAAYNLIVDRTGVTGAGGSLVYIGQAGLAAIGGLAQAPISDTLTLNSTAGSLVYAPGAASTITASLSAGNATKDVLATADNVRLGAQSAITVAIAAEQMSVALGGADAATYDLDMLVHSPAGVNQQFAATNVSIEPGMIQIIGIPAQIGASLPMTRVLAATGETTPATLPNESVGDVSLYLPEIVR